jgi:positive regulator of sigma E activity
MASAEVSHKGRIVSVGNGKVSVQIVSESACSACHAAGLCGASESRKKIVEVPVLGNASYSVGQEVEVCLARKMGLKAVLLSYVIPLLILMILVLSLSRFGLGELACGLASIGGIAVYYLILYLCRDHLAEGYVFYIRNI